MCEWLWRTAEKLKYARKQNIYSLGRSESRGEGRDETGKVSGTVAESASLGSDPQCPCVSKENIFSRSDLNLGSSMKWSVCVQSTNLAETEWRERSKTYWKRIQPCTALKRSLWQTMCLLFVHLVVVNSTYSFQLELPAKHKMLDVTQFELRCWFRFLPLFLRVLWVSI